MFLPPDCPPLHTGVLLPKFFDKTFLPVHIPHSSEEEAVPLTFLIDRIAGLIKVPFLIWEAERIQEMLQRKHLEENEFACLSTISISSNAIEFICWLGERGYLEITLPIFVLLRKIYYIFKIILYNYAVLIDSELLHGAQQLEKSEERTYIRLLLLSHMLNLSCMVLGWGSLTMGTPCSRRLLRMLQFSSLLFDLASQSYEWRWGETKELRIKTLKRPLIKQNFIYA